MENTFIDVAKIEAQLEAGKNAGRGRIEEILAHARQKKGLAPDEVASLIGLDDPELLEEMFKLAREIKEDIYGRRIVLFAPLYVSNLCSNECVYCGFRASNKAEDRHALTTEELKQEILALEKVGHKRVLMVFGEHPRFGADYMAEMVRAAYEVKTPDGKGEVRRINVNAAPLDVPDYRIVKDSGIGTYQIFQETYHPGRYSELHLKGRKRDYAYRLYALHRAQEAGIDDVAVGPLLGLYDWRFELMGVVYHALDMERQFNVGPHTISFPRLEPAIDTPFIDETPYKVSDADFKKLVAIVRLTVPYTGMILTCREKPELRREVIKLGVSQIDGGSRIGIGAYNDAKGVFVPQRQQFFLSDSRTLDEVVHELAEGGFIPSFCTACYRTKRTGEHFMDYAKEGFVKNFCQPNALFTFKEYLEDFASPQTRALGEAVIARELLEVPAERQDQVREKLVQITGGKRDLYY